MWRISFFYDPAGGLYQASRSNLTHGYTNYDAVQRLHTVEHYYPGAASSADSASIFSLNPANQLAGESRGNDAYAWTGHYAVNRGYTANGLNQYSAAGGATFGYDANGNLTSDGSRSYVYDIENRLVSSSNGAALSYDPLGRLWQVTLGTSTTRFLYDGDALVGEYDGAGAMIARYVHGGNADDPMLWYAGAGLANLRFLHANRQGSIIATSDASGTATINSYDEHGIPATTNQGRFQYTGQAWLPEIGMYYYRARIYSPSLGRFMQTDRCRRKSAEGAPRGNKRTVTVILRRRPRWSRCAGGRTRRAPRGDLHRPRARHGRPLRPRVLRRRRRGDRDQCPRRTRPPRRRHFPAVLRPSQPWAAIVAAPE
jgi:RHS repeat-associated protein